MSKQLMIVAANETTPSLAEPQIGKWYCGMLFTSTFEDQPDQGELMRYDGDDCWMNEQEDPDGREPDPADYDYLVEQL